MDHVDGTALCGTPDGLQSELPKRLVQYADQVPEDGACCGAFESRYDGFGG